MFSQYRLSDQESLIKNQRICQRNSYTSDTLKEKFLSNIIYYDSLGRSSHEITYDSDNEIEAEIITKYKADSLEITTYNTSGSVDTCIEKYDRFGRKIYEHWFWADDSPDETWFEYEKNSDKLISSLTKYSFGLTIDSLFYSNKRLILKKRFNENRNLVKEFEYNYKNDLLVELKELNTLTGQIESLKKYSYNNEGNMIHMSDESNYSNRMIEHFIRYDKNQIKRIDKVLIISFNKLQSTVFHIYDKNGLEIKMKEDFPNGKTHIIRCTYLKFK